MKEIDNYMTPTAATKVYGVNASTLRNKLQDGYSVKADQDRTYLIEQGWLKYYDYGTPRKEWIIHKKAIEYWFPKKER